MIINEISKNNTALRIMRVVPLNGKNELSV